MSFLVGMVLFGEYLSLFEIYGLVLGCGVILLLNNKKNRALQVDYKKGLAYLAWSNVLILFSSTINKYMMSGGFDVMTYMFLSGIFGALYLLTTKKDLYEASEFKANREEIKIGLFRGVLKFFGFSAFLIALSKGPFALVQLMHLSVILIPIILSVIFFNEKLNIQKILAFILFGCAAYLIHL
ncbi:EamA family transporter [Candidatus Gracilibacteria bacterium]|nr:EamA family transporter [Candidatus Gracilibacteria bacterium]